MEDIKITNNIAHTRFEATVNGELARLDYQVRDHNIAIMYVYVPPQERGNGIAGKLIVAALDFARQQNKKVMLYCSFAASYVKAHKELYDYVDKTFHPTFMA